MKKNRKPRGFNHTLNPAFIGNAPIPSGIENIDMLLFSPPSMGYEICNNNRNPQKMKS